MSNITNYEIIYEVFVENVFNLAIFRYLLLPTLLATITAAYLEVQVSEIVRQLSKNIGEKKDSSEALKYYFYFIISSAFLSEVVGFVFTGVVQYIFRTTNRNTFRQFIELSPKVFNNIGSGKIQSIIDRKSKASSELVEVLVVNVFPVICTLSFVSVSVFKKLGLYPCSIIILSVIFYALLTIGIAIWRTNIRRKLNTAENVSNNKLQDSLINHETIYSYGTTDLEVSRYDEKLINIQSNANTLWRALYVLNFSQKTIFLFQSTSIILMGVRGYLSNSLSASDLVFFISISRTLNNCLGNLGFMYSRFTQAMINAKSTFEIVGKKEEKKETFTNTTFNDKIDFVNVNFSYENKLMFTNLSFEIKKGEKVAIIGKNGVGKSTLIKLMLRFEKYEGTIMMDGMDVQDISEESFRNTVTYIPQNGFLFEESVIYNMKYGSKNVSNEEIYKLSKLFGCYETFSKLEKGFETFVGERGKLLSGGERQKILIIRAILNDKKVFVLDEPTSALDKQSELNVLNAFVSKPDATVVMIIHNLELINKFDKILFIHDKSVEVIKSEGKFVGGSSKELGDFLQSSKISDLR
ncbi:ATP-binding cassette sub-family B member 7, mitochondrial [Nosema granulosis]|uniref:ATP-binding cassette sub-family B member 7, mitochondrial n=1 Tax=Nosema granulosis TaxID=83296 RepID=A0A9P6GYP5_9MICR|nr:ATP-binding cassette sub-family B member 7, mitochondrial [Nosema granulosis]